MLIIASVGCNVNEEKIKKIILSGADILRFNFSYYDINENVEYLKNTQEIINSLHSSVQTLIDLPLNKIRLGDFENKILPVRENDLVTMKSASFSPDSSQFIPVNTLRLGEKVQINQTMSLGDGQIFLQVENILNFDTIVVKVLNNGVIRYLKTLNIPHKISDEEILSQYSSILKTITSFAPKYIAFSYISPLFKEKIKQLPELIKLKNTTKFIIKIEEYITNQEIISLCEDTFFDMILIDRGELGVNMPFQKIGIFQEYIVNLAQKHNKKTIISTHILESTINSFIPNRADVLDLTHIVLSNADGIMFCNETGVGSRPAYTISTAKKIIEETQKYKNANEKDKMR